MNVKNRIKSLIALTALVTLPGAYAGNQGVFFYYGAGAGVVAVDEQSGYTALDPAGSGSIFAGIEEDGWALEYIGYQTLETGTDVNNIDYKVTGSIISLGYRTIEKGSTYYKFAYGKADSDLDIINTTTDAKVSGSMKGKVFTIGMGLRLQKGNRMELDYSLYDPSSDDVDGISKIHMLTARYLFEGAPASNK